MDIVLIPGLWLPTSAWDDVCRELRDLGDRGLPVALPGVDDRSTSATLDDQIGAVLAVVDGAHRPVVVGHSAASTLAWMAADRRPDVVAAAVMVGGFPSDDGATYAAFFDVVDGVMAFPGWEPFEGADSDDLDAAARARFERTAVPVAAGVAQGVVHLTDERRYDVPAVLVCPEFSPDDARGWVEAGDVAELARARAVSYVDIDSGHWPMLTRPAELARLLHDIAADAA